MDNQAIIFLFVWRTEIWSPQSFVASITKSKLINKIIWEVTINENSIYLVWLHATSIKWKHDIELIQMNNKYYLQLDKILL